MCKTVLSLRVQSHVLALFGSVTERSYLEKQNKSITSCIIFVGENSRDQQRAKSDNVGKENTGYFSHSCLRTDDHSPGGRVGSPETTTLTPMRRRWLLCQTDLVKCFPGGGHRAKVPFVLSSGLWRQPWVVLVPHKSGCQ